MKTRPQDLAKVQALLASYQAMGVITEAETTQGLQQWHLNREPMLQGLIDFRQRQHATANWRKNRWKTMRGVKRWHKSMDGKRFHRALGTHLATRIVRDTRTKRPERPSILQRSEALEASPNQLLIALASLRTHLYLEREYYRPLLEEELDVREFVAYCIPHLQRLEEKVFQNPSATFTADEHELLLRLIDRKALWKAFAEVYQCTVPLVESTIRLCWKRLRQQLPYSSAYFMTDVTALLAQMLEHERYG